MAVTSTCRVSRAKAYQAFCPDIFRRRAQGEEPGNEARFLLCYDPVYVVYDGPDTTDVKGYNYD